MSYNKSVGGYVVSLKEGEASIIQMTDWCSEKHAGCWKSLVLDNTLHFIFKNEEDAVAFKLKFI